MDSRQEHEVAEGLRAGRSDAWQALYDAYARPLWHAVARQMQADVQGVADVVQETFLAAARAARQYDAARGTLWMWLCGIARQQVALHFRVRLRHERLRHDDAAGSEAVRRLIDWLDHRDPAPSDALAAAEVAGLVRAALSELPEEYEMLLAARYFDGMSVEDLARQMNSTATAVRSKLARARRAFRDAVSGREWAVGRGSG